jgi:WD40 repeat protein
MAVGLTTGKVDLIRLEAGKQAQQKNILSSGPSVTLPIRNSRSCNALAFSEADSNYLAVGLDKVRGASSLIIWDINTFTSSLTLSINAPNNVTSPAPRPQPQIPKLDHQATSRMDQHILQRHAPTEVVSSLAFLPSSTHLLLAGISHRWLRLFDLRSQTTGINVASKVHGIATDPFDPYRVACFGDGVVNVWDARKLNQPLLMFSERDAIAGGSKLRPGSVYTNIEFSSTRRGCLATLEKDSSYVRFWDLLEVKMHSAEENMAGGGRVQDAEIRTSRDSTRASRRSWAANLPWPAGDKQQISPKQKDVFELSSQSTFTMSDTRKSGSSLLISLHIWPYNNSYQLNISLGHWPPLLWCRIPIYRIRWLRKSWLSIRMAILNSMLYTTLPNNLYGALEGNWQ